jgi:GNAT superfamily N-acetyltransferase
MMLFCIDGTHGYLKAAYPMHDIDVNDSELFARQHRSLRSFYELLSRGASEARLLELDGVTACVSPATPDRSFPNAVVYDRPEQLEAAIGELADAYDGAGVRAWTVWVPERDTRSAALLERSGHTLDATPAAMACGIDELEAAPRGDAAIERDADMREVARINDVAYGGADDFQRLMQARPAGLHTYAARVAGTPVSVAAAYDTDGDCGIFMVATLPEGRGRGLATQLVACALEDGRERGCTTTSLQATKMGYPIYARLGYRDLGALQMWERRRAAD